MGETLMVGMAEIKVTRSSDEVLIALGLGSCIGVCAYDPQARVAGLAHVVLPDSAGHDANAGKFADTAIPLLLAEMQKLGASVPSIRTALVGGAQLFAFNGSGPRLEIGLRNATAVQAILKQRAILVQATDLGGTAGRTVTLFPDGRVRVKVIGRGEQELTTLGGAESAGRMAGVSSPPGPRAISAEAGLAALRAPGLQAIRERR